MQIKFTVPSIPVAQPRPRATAINGQARMYQAPKTHAVHAFKAAVQMAAAEAYQGAPLECPLGLAVVFVLDRKGKLKKRSPNPTYYANKKPDLDNLMKSLADALNGLLYRDDSQICEAVLTKRVAAGDEQPHVEVHFQELDNEEMADWYGR